MTAVTERPALIPQKHGGALYAGGVKGNNGGGGVPDLIKGRVSLRMAKFVEAEGCEIVEDIARKADHGDSLKAVKLAASLGELTPQPGQAGAGVMFQVAIFSDRDPSPPPAAPDPE